MRLWLVSLSPSTLLENVLALPCKPSAQIHVIKNEVVTLATVPAEAYRSAARNEQPARGSVSALMVR